MKNKIGVVLLAVCIGVLFLHSFTSGAEQEKKQLELINKVVTITTHYGIKPPDVVSTPGTTVIWVSQTNTPHEILFLDKKVVMACSSPVNFFVGKDGAYESGKIPFGGTASLCFVEKGKYEYTVKPSKTFYKWTKDEVHKGSVTIK
jgi:plastocyanin